MKLQVFDGGLSTRFASHLIKTNEALVYNNIDNTLGILTPVKKPKLTGIKIDEYAFFYKKFNFWVSSSKARNYVEYNNVLYFSQVGSNPKKFDGKITSNLGISGPTTTPVIAIQEEDSLPLDGIFQYVYTYFNKNDGAESKPSGISQELQIKDGSINITNLLPSIDPQVTNIRLYRVGGGLTLFSLVIELPAEAISHIDSISDTEIDGRSLESEGFEEAPDNLNFLTNYNDTFLGAIGNRLRFTEFAKPNAWPELNFIDFEDPITGIGVTAIGAVIFTKFKTWLIIGTKPNVFVRRIFSSTQGSVDHNSIVSFNNTIIWVSLDGICTIANNKVRVLTQLKTGKIKLSPINAVLFDEQYFLQLKDTTLLVMDFRIGGILKTYSVGSTRLIVAEDVLYGYFTNTIKELFAANDNEEFNYVSPVLTEGTFTNFKTYKSVYIKSEDCIVITILIDDEIVIEKTITKSGITEIKVPQDKQRGASIQIKINGTGSVQEIEFKPLGRSNGK